MNNYSNISKINCDIFQTIESFQDFAICYSYFFKIFAAKALLEIVRN